MTISFDIDAVPRTDAGKGASRRLRRAGLVPGIIYGGHKEPEMIATVHNELLQHLEHESFYSHILTVDVAGNKQKVVLKDMQRHPSKPFVLHLDLLRVTAHDKIRVHVPLHFVNEAKAPGVKMGGTVSHQLTDVEVSCLPTDLPEFIEIDMSNMAMGEALHLSDIKLPEGVEIPALASEGAEDPVVVNIHGGHVAPTAEEEGGEEEVPAPE
jgi:large subunit ribosomal protein L25